MEKRADYCVSRVRYGGGRKHIVQVQVHEDRGDTMGAASHWGRAAMLLALEGGESFMTIFEGADSTWQPGQQVHLVTVDCVKYIRTDHTQTPSDNLERVPELRLHASADELLDSLFLEDLEVATEYDPDVLKLVKAHLGQQRLHSRAGARLAEALVQLAQARAKEQSL